MKKIIKTKIIDLNGEENKKTIYLPVHDISYSVIDLGMDNALVRMAGKREVIEKIIKDKEIKVLTDEEGLIELRRIYSFASLENLNIKDDEVDDIATMIEINPQIRADITITELERPVLEEQEIYLLQHICERMKISKKYWNEKSKLSGKWKDGQELEDEIRNGKCEAHNFILEHIRARKK